MSERKLLTVLERGADFPAIRRAFSLVDRPETPEVALWREVAARLVLDALGETGLNGEPAKHNRAVREARLLFRMQPACAEGIFFCAGLDFAPVRGAVLRQPGRYIED